MNLDDWIALTPDARNAERANWGHHNPIEDDEQPWGGLLYEACMRFRREFGQHPLINRIDHGAVRILVTVALYPPQFIEDIPSRYCGFLVEQDPINANRDYYLRYWRILFGELLGWTETETDDWAMRWDDDLNGRTGSMFYHEDVYYYVLPEILNASGASVAAPMHSIFRALEDAIQFNASSPIWLSPVDWNAVRERVNDVLTRHGGKLPR